MLGRNNELQEQTDIIIDIQNVSKSFYIASDKKDTLRQLFVSIFNQGKSKKFNALEGITLQIRRGEFIGIVGRNGSGKSTLLKLIADIYEPDKGGILDVKGSLVPFLELGVGFNPDLTGRENIYLNGTILGMTKKYLDQKYEDIVEFSELGEFIYTPIKNYSSGMKVKLAFSIAVQAEADIYILDEVLGVGDGAFRQKSVRVIKDLVDKGKTILYVSHSLGSVEKYCDRVVWLHRGRVAYDGDVATGVNQYKELLLDIEKAQTEEAEKEKSYPIEIIRTFIEEYSEGNVKIVAKLVPKEKLDQIHAVFDVYQDEESILFSADTMSDQVKIPGHARKVELTIMDMNLKSGDYYIDITLLAADGETKLFKEEKAGVFRVPENVNSLHPRGVLDFEHKWTHLLENDEQ